MTLSTTGVVCESYRIEVISRLEREQDVATRAFEVALHYLHTENCVYPHFFFYNPEYSSNANDDVITTHQPPCFSAFSLQQQYSVSCKTLEFHFRLCTHELRNFPFSFLCKIYSWGQCFMVSTNQFARQRTFFYSNPYYYCQKPYR